MSATRAKLAQIAAELAQLPFHGNTDGSGSNIAPLIAHFPKWNVQAADKLWCAAFVYHCCIRAGYEIPYSPDECVTCSLAGCGGFEEFAVADDRIEYHPARSDFAAAPGDIVIFDRVFIHQAHDHIGIIVGREADALIVAEGNVPGTNTSGIVRRSLDEHIRCYIRFPDGYRYR